MANFSDIIRPVAQTKTFSLSQDALKALQKMKSRLGDATLQPIDEAVPFTVETDASDYAIAAILHARTLSSTEQKHSSV